MPQNILQTPWGQDHVARSKDVRRHVSVKLSVKVLSRHMSPTPPGSKIPITCVETPIFHLYVQLFLLVLYGAYF